MARKRHSDEGLLKLLRRTELKLLAGNNVTSACHNVGISDASQYNCWKWFGGIRRTQLSESKRLGKENDEPLERHWSERQWRMLEKIVAELKLDKLILDESLNPLKPKVPLTGR